MLKEHEAVATIAVKDTSAARKFYEGQLGLKPEDAHDDDIASKYHLLMNYINM